MLVFFKHFFTIFHLSSWLHPVCLQSAFLNSTSSAHAYWKRECWFPLSLTLDPAYCQKLIWSPVFDLSFCTSFLCNSVCLQLHLVSTDDFLLDHFLWKCWGQQRQSTYHQLIENLDRKSILAKQYTYDLHGVWLLETLFFSLNSQVREPVSSKILFWYKAKFESKDLDICLQALYPQWKEIKPWHLNREIHVKLTQTLNALKQLTCLTF